MLLGVNSDPDATELKQILAREKITWRSWWDLGRKDGPIHLAWQVKQRPTIHLLDAKGVIRYSNIDPEKIDGAIDKLLAEMKKK